MGGDQLSHRLSPITKPAGRAVETKLLTSPLEGDVRQDRGGAKARELIALSCCASEVGEVMC